LLPLVVAAHDRADAARLPQGIQLVDEDDARAFSCAWARSRTRAAPTPTNISTKSEPLKLKNGTRASPGGGLGQQCLPSAGRADDEHALGIVPPRRR
jgi:hypothetical protein